MKPKHKKLLFVATLLSPALVIATLFGAKVGNKFFMTKATEPEYSVNLGQITADEASAASFSRTSTGGNPITFNISGTVARLSGYVANMSYADDNSIYNVTPITGMKSLTFQFANHLNIRVLYGSTADCADYASPFYDDTYLNQDVTIDFEDTVNVKYFKIIHFKGSGAYLKTCSINYSCAPKETRGEAFEAGVALSKTVSYSATDTVTMDVKFTTASNTYLNIALLTDWSNFYGYFEIKADGSLGSAYDGILVYPLNDGYMRVEFDLASLSKYSGTPSNITILYIRGSDWTTGSGYVEFEPEKEEIKTYATKSFASGEGLTYDIPGSNIQPHHGMMFTIAFDPNEASKKSFTIAIMTDWSNWYGNYSLYNDGSVNNSTGIKIFKLADKTYQYFIDDLSALTVHQASPVYVDLLYLRPANCAVGATITISAIF